MQRQINRIFRVFRFFAKIYINDIVIFNHNLEKHLRYLNQVFVLFVKFNIVLKSSKTYLRYFTISLFEQKIDRFELSIAQKKLAIILQLKFFKILKILKIYLSMIE